MIQNRAVSHDIKRSDKSAIIYHLIQNNAVSASYADDLSTINNNDKTFSADTKKALNMSALISGWLDHAIEY
ncbi:hypothetical protein JCM19235_1282 [Vibrio maritimus]|uniref:Uncharacterized protein n=1 Tax=Vibrio maritimus TaxID=990268 RepID=A0A090S638_9VIBR|nr:hypothetical protein JCM19235_1282 [Vibrio maritimus]